MNRLAKHISQQNYDAACNMLATIHAEIAPQLQAKRKADALLDNCAKGRPTKDASEKLTREEKDARRKYLGAHICEIGHLRGTESLVAPDSFEACAVQGMAKAEDCTRHVADNN